MKCYNGCPDSYLQAEIDARDKIRQAIIDLGFTVTYFPYGEFYQAFTIDYRLASAEHKSLAGVLNELQRNGGTYAP